MRDPLQVATFCRLEQVGLDVPFGLRDFLGQIKQPLRKDRAGTRWKFYGI